MISIWELEKQARTELLLCMLFLASSGVALQREKLGEILSSLVKPLCMTYLTSVYILPHSTEGKWHEDGFICIQWNTLIKKSKQIV